jgi:hypothetical protein
LNGWQQLFSAQLLGSLLSTSSSNLSVVKEAN